MTLSLLRKLCFAFIFMQLINTGLSGQVVLSSSPYTENFDNIASGYPTGWTGRTGSSATSLGTAATLTTTPTAWNNTSGAFKNVASADGLPSNASSTDQSNSTDRSLAVRQTGSFGDPGAAFVLQLANTVNISAMSISFKIQSLDIASPRLVTWKVQYGIGTTPSTFTDITTSPSTLTTGGSTYSNTTVTATLPSALENVADNIWIRIVTLTNSTGSGSRPTTGIDDFQMDFTMGTPIVADHLEFDNPPTDAVVGEPFNLTICAKDPSDQIQPDYLTPIALTQIMGTAATITPSSPQVPIGGCVTYTITPNASNENITFEAASGTFPDIQTGLYVWDTPATCYTDNCNMQIVPVSTNEENDNWSCNSGVYSINGYCPTCIITTESWLISQQYSITPTPFSTFDFTLNQNFSGPDLEIYYTLNYTGNPSTTTWVSLGTAGTDGNFSFDISGISGTNVRFGIKYTATGSSGQSSSYQVSDITIKSVDCSNIILGSCLISSIDINYSGTCNNQGTTLVTDDTRSADITVNTNTYQPSTGTLDLYIDNVLTASLPVSSMTSYTFNSIDLPANNTAFDLKAEFSDDASCSLTNTVGPLSSCSPPFGLAFNPPLNAFYYSMNQADITVCFVDDNGNLSPQNPMPVISLLDNPDLMDINSTTPDANNACYHFNVTFNSTGNVELTASDNVYFLSVVGNTEIIDFPCVFISEVVDPTSGNNKYVEIYNGSSNPVDISNYKLNIYRNGSTTLGDAFLVWPGTILQPGYTYVFSNSGSTLDYTDCGANVTMNTNLNSNGDDAYELVDGNNNVLDRFGVVGEDPAPNTSWNYVDKVVHRNYDIYCGTPIFDLSEWTFEPYTSEFMGTPCHHCVDVEAYASSGSEVNTFCPGEEIELSVYTVGGNYFQWSGPNGFSSTEQYPDIIVATDEASGTYYVSVTSGPGCDTIVDSLQIIVIPKPLATASVSPNPACIGSTVQFLSTGGDYYEWTGPDGFTSSSDSPTLVISSLAQEGEYSVVVTNFCGDSDTAAVFLDIIEPFEATASVDPNPACEGTDVQLSVTEGDSYQWTGPNGFSSNSQNPIISGITMANAGDYYVTVSKTMPCSPDTVVTSMDTLNVQVLEIFGLTVTASDNPICSGGTLYLNAMPDQTGTYTFAWTGPNGFTSNIQNPSIGNIQTNQSGTYYVTVTLDNGCSKSDSIEIIVNPVPAISVTATPNPICAGETLNLGTTSGAFYQWLGPNGFTSNIQNPTISNIQVNQAGTYYVTVTSAQGCTATGNVEVIVNPTPSATANVEPNPVCTDNKVQFTATGGIFYAWSGPGGFNSSQQNPMRYIANTGQGGIYTVTVTNSDGCSNTASVNLVVNQTPNGTIGASPNPICVGNTLQLTASGGDSYQWSGPQGFTSTQQNPSITNFQLNQSGAYYVTISNGNGCSQTLFVKVVGLSLPFAAIKYEQNTACVGSDLQLYGEGIGYYNWSGPNGFTSTDKNPVIPNVTASNSGIYQLIVTGPNGCSTTTEINIVIHDLPDLTMPVPFLKACEGSTVQLFADGEGSFNWSGPWGFASPYQNPLIYTIPEYMTGYYIVTLEGETGCISQDSMFVQVGGYIKASAWADPNPVCEGTSFQLHAEGGDYYQWTGPNGFHSNEQNPVIDNMDHNKEGKYGVLITNEEGCQDFQVVEVTMTPLEGKAWAVANPNPITKNDKFLQLFSSPGVSYSWSGPNGFTSNIQNPIIKITGPEVAGLYIVTITLNSGCPAVAKVIVRYNRLPIEYPGIIGDNHQGDETNITEKVFPNPTNGMLYFDTPLTGSIQYAIFNSQSKSLQSLISTDQRFISVENLSSGIYYIRWHVAGSNNWNVSKFVKIH